MTLCIPHSSKPLPRPRRREMILEKMGEMHVNHEREHLHSVRITGILWTYIPRFSPLWVSHSIHQRLASFKQNHNSRPLLLVPRLALGLPRPFSYSHLLFRPMLDLFPFVGVCRLPELSNSLKLNGELLLPV